MPTKWTRPLALVVVLTASLSMAPWLIAAEGKSSQLADTSQATPSPAAEEGASPTTSVPASEPGEGLRYVHQEGATTIGGGSKKLEAYSFIFGDTAYIPENVYPEAMVVQVRSGSFALRVGKEDLVIADPAGQTIPILEPTGDPVLVSDPNQTKGVVTRLDGDECTDLCALPQSRQSSSTREPPSTYQKLRPASGAT